MKKLALTVRLQFDFEMQFHLLIYFTTFSISVFKFNLKSILSLKSEPN